MILSFKNTLEWAILSTVMRTEFIQMNINQIDADAIQRGGQILAEGGLVAFPTETVYGLGGDALNPDASRKIYEAKGRPSDNPLIVHIADMDSLYKIAACVPDSAIRLANRYWPGPLTMIFPKKDIVPLETTGGLNTVAVRFPNHPVALALIKASGGFIAAPSANTSGRPSPTTGQHVFDDLNGKIPMILDSGNCQIGLESTIVDFSDDIPTILRPGYISLSMLQEILGEVRIDPAIIDQNADLHLKPKAPGMKYRHYAPKGDLTIVGGSQAAVRDFICERIIEAKKQNNRVGVITCSDCPEAYRDADYVGIIGERDNEDEIAAGLYRLLRSCDDENLDIIYSEKFDSPRMGMAIMNRLMKAAGHKEVDL